MLLSGGVPGRSGPLERNSVPCRRAAEEVNSKAAQKFRAFVEDLRKTEKVSKGIMRQIDLC